MLLTSRLNINLSVEKNDSIYKPANICLFTVNNKNIKKKVRNMFSVKNWDTIKIYIVNFENISHLFLVVFLLLLILDR